MKDENEKLVKIKIKRKSYVKMKKLVEIEMIKKKTLRSKEEIKK